MRVDHSQIYSPYNRNRKDKIMNYLNIKSKFNFHTHSDKFIDTKNVKFISNISTSYEAIIYYFALPISDFNKTFPQDWEWRIKFSDGKVAVISNWKNGPNYTENRKISPNNINKWRVYGSSKKVFDYLVLMFL